MIELPPSVAPWRASLELLARELALTLAPLVDRLALALGPLPTASALGAGEPDGYYGLARRGSYERLVMSEWLLADELPEEFARRAAAGEHLFVASATKWSRHGRRSIALFDGGPQQLGTPRVAQLALLIALFHRAQQADARFGWGLLQRPDRPLIDGVTEHSTRTLLLGHFSIDATDEHVQTWKQLLGPLHSADELWLIGPDTLTPLHETTIAVRDPLLDERQLQVTLRRRGRPPLALTLELPSDGDCARLLRDPFVRGAGRRAPPATRLSAPAWSKPVFSPDSRRLMTLLADHTLAITYVPNSLRDPLRPPGRFVPTTGELIVAAGMEDGRITVITVDEEARIVSLSSIGKRGGVRRLRSIDVPAGKPLPCARVDRLGRCASRVKAARTEPDYLVFSDGDDRLFEIGGGTLSAGGRVDALALFDGVPLYVERAEAVQPGKMQPVLRWTKNGFLRDGPRFTVTGPALSRGFLVGTRRSEGMVALVGNGRVELKSLAAVGDDEGISLAHDARSGSVVGFLLAGAMVVLRSDSRTIDLVTRHRVSKLATSSDEVIALTLCDQTRRLAYVTQPGAIVVISTSDGSELVRQLPEPRS